jgi:hypothetical protein
MFGIDLRTTSDRSLQMLTGYPPESTVNSQALFLFYLQNRLKLAAGKHYSAIWHVEKLKK